ncbi:MAG TPA: DUF1616 domain-containing protein, partial [Anaerovoracaceae bacterium]|nr:DUF1616 domain-containing protein [Anaerovoracaceae bacterium]
LVLRVVDEKNPRTLRELVLLVQKDSESTERAVLDVVLKLKDEGRIRLSDSSLSVLSSFSSYLMSSFALWFWVGTAIALLTMVVTLFIGENFYPWSFIRNILGLIFVLWLPGFAFIKAVFPVKTELKSSNNLTNLTNVERIALSVIMSLSWIALISLVLNFTPWGINVMSILLSLSSFSLVLLVVAVIREYLTRNEI